MADDDLTVLHLRELELMAEATPGITHVSTPWLLQLIADVRAKITRLEEDVANLEYELRDEACNEV